MPIALRRGQGMSLPYSTGAPSSPPPLHITPNAATSAGSYAVRPLAGGVVGLVLTSDIRPQGPIVDRNGARQPGGVGTDPTDSTTWRRPYIFT